MRFSEREQEKIQVESERKTVNQSGLKYEKRKHSEHLAKYVFVKLLISIIRVRTYFELHPNAKSNSIHQWQRRQERVRMSLREKARARARETERTRERSVEKIYG